MLYSKKNRGKEKGWKREEGGKNLLFPNLKEQIFIFLFIINFDKLHSLSFCIQYFLWVNYISHRKVYKTVMYYKFIKWKVITCIITAQVKKFNITKIESPNHFSQSHLWSLMFFIFMALIKNGFTVYVFQKSLIWSAFKVYVISIYCMLLLHIDSLIKFIKITFLYVYAIYLC